MTVEEHALTEADRIAIFTTATRGFADRHADAIEEGMTDADLKEALQQVLGIFGGYGGPDDYSITFTGNGLRIWGGRHVVNHVTEKPLFSGKRTIEMARQVYGIADPNDRQLTLF